MKKLLIILCFVFLLLIPSVSCLPAFELDGKLHEVLELLPGSSFQGIIALRNTSDEKEVVEITQSDYFFNAEGKVQFGKKGTDPRSNAVWIEIEPTNLVLEPGAKATVRYQVKVPRGLNLKGTYWSLINFDHRIEEETLTEAERSKENETAMSVEPLLGFSFQVITNIGKSGNVAMDMKNPKLVKTGKEFIFSIDIHCVGEIMLNVIPWVEVFNADGEKVLSANGMKSTILPGCSFRHNFELGTMDKGDYKLLLIADCGEDQVFGGQYVLEIE